MTPWCFFTPDTNFTDIGFPASLTDAQEFETPEDISLYQNYPNPFNPSTKIKFGLPKSEFVAVEVYNMLGQKVATLLNERMTAGYHEIEFDGARLSSGVYFYKIQAGQYYDIKKMILLR